MTLAQNAQVQEALRRLDEWHHPAAEHTPETHEAAQVALIEAVRLALLAEWSAGEGLDWDAARRDALANKGQGFGVTDNIKTELNRQHRARLAAERSKAEKARMALGRIEQHGLVAGSPEFWNAITDAIAALEAP